MRACHLAAREISTPEELFRPPVHYKTPLCPQRTVEGECPRATRAGRGAPPTLRFFPSFLSSSFPERTRGRARRGPRHQQAHWRRRGGCLLLCQIWIAAVPHCSAPVARIRGSAKLAHPSACCHTCASVNSVSQWMPACPVRQLCCRLPVGFRKQPEGGALAMFVPTMDGCLSGRGHVPCCCRCC